MADIARSPWAEAAWYFPESREQFRLVGRLSLVAADTPDAALQQARMRPVWGGGGSLVCAGLVLGPAAPV